MSASEDCSYRPCSSCGRKKSCLWADEAWVCQACGDEWYPDHGPEYAAPTPDDSTLAAAAQRLVDAVEAHAKSGGWARVNWTTEGCEKAVMEAVAEVRAVLNSGSCEDQPCG